MITEYSIRHVEDGDIEWLRELNNESYHDVVVRQFGNWNEDCQRDWFDKKWKKVRPAKIITIGNERIGVVVLERRDSYDWLDEILIISDYRGHGIGTSLMRQVIADARRRNRRLRLRVLHNNHSAKRFYERLGFVTLETLEDHYLMEVDPLVTDR
jgi:ribosomal protein S18 acetylase RimI-like enzyme